MKSICLKTLKDRYYYPVSTFDYLFTPYANKKINLTLKSQFFLYVCK